MTETDFNSDIINFLNERQASKSESDKLYQKAVDLFQKGQLKPKESQSNQERLAFLKSIRFTAAATLVFTQVTGDYANLQFLNEHFTNENIVNLIGQIPEAGLSASTLLPIEMQEASVDFFKELTKYFDPDKIDLATPLAYFIGFASTSAGVRGINLSKRRFFEEDIAKYSDDLKTDKNATTKNAIRKFANFTDEYQFKKALTTINPLSKIGLFVANMVVDMFKTIASPINTVKKSFLMTKMSLNEVNYMLGKDFQNNLQKTLKRENYIRKIKNIEGDYNPTETAQFISTTKEFKYQDIDATSQIGSLDMVFNSIQSAYDDTLKINVKNSLAKSIMILGDPNSSKNKKKEAVIVLNNISRLHENTTDNRFDHYKILSGVATDYIDKIKKDKKVYSFKESNEINKTGFEQALHFINRKQEEKLKLLGKFNESDKNDPNKKIVDEMSFNELFDIAVKHQLQKLKRDDQNLDSFHLDKNEEIEKKSKKRNKYKIK